MQTRLHRAMRLRQLQKRMHQLAEQELAVLERRVEAADAAQADLIRTLNAASWFHEPIRATSVRRLKSLAVAAQDLRAARAAAAQQLHERATQHKRSELWVGRLQIEQRHRAEKQDWAERLDLLTTPDASPRSAKSVKRADGSSLSSAPAISSGSEGQTPSRSVTPDPRAP